MERLEAGHENLTPAQTDLLKRANRQALFMHRLVGDARLLSRLREGEAPSGGGVQLVEILKRALYLVRSMHFDRSFDVFVDCPANVWVASLPLAESVFVNLLDNAVRHTPAEARPEIEVSASAEGSTILLTIRGGTPPEKEVLARLFEPFCRGKSSRGSGLGLALVRQILERAGGRIEARVAQESFGSVFEVVVRLPAAKGLTVTTHTPPRSVPQQTVSLT